MIEEIVPGVVQWDAFRETIRRRVHSTFVLSSGTLIDPMVPDGDGGLDAVAELATPRRIVLSNRLHYRDSARYAKRFGCPVLCHEAGLSHFADERPVQGFSFDEQLADDVRALELGSICAEETTLLLDVDGVGALSFGDGLTRDEDGALAFMPDSLLGEDAEEVRTGLAKNLRRMLDEDFDTLLFAHAEPVSDGGRALLGEFLAKSSELQ
jgi:hypothetical protein